ncbi:farnesol dehydrogenase-like [Homalodisca vitripennis]|uniref:farnesol dehydrogenase-like n=1 Tax=Homalodisca vitripennis TaxID=197043 RepID=UPI001EEAF7DC|nr:farnesol dehydrogenase-like [Homalodisca vitripennis]
MERWQGRVAVVTGASAGIGAAIVENLVESGMVVVGLARREDHLLEIKDKLKGKLGTFHPIKADITKEEDFNKAFEWITENLGGLDVLVNNAGVVVTSYIPASKHAAKVISEGLRMDLASQKSKIKVTNISPGLVATPMLDSFKEGKELNIFFEPLNAKDIADAVHYVLGTPPNVQVAHKELVHYVRLIASWPEGPDADDMRWQGRVAVVTGASAGIGAAILEDLVESGMVVVGLARREDHGNIEEWRKMFELNVFAVGACAREAINSMKERNVDDGHIININSLASHWIPDFPGITPYSSSKHASLVIGEGLRRELASQKSKIKVTSISPGIVETEMFDSFRGGQDITISIEPLTAKDIADAVHYVLGTPPNVQVNELTIRPVGDGNLMWVCLHVQLYFHFSTFTAQAYNSGLLNSVIPTMDTLTDSQIKYKNQC